MLRLTRRQLFHRMGALSIAATWLLNACAPAATSPATEPARPTTETTATAATPMLPSVNTTATTTAPAPMATATPTAVPAYLAVARGVQPAQLVERAVAALGGIECFVPAGADVIVKPNICIASYTYEYAATTNPEVVATLVRLCLGAGAKRVRVMDQPFSGTAEAAYARSGIAEAVKTAGGQMEVMTPIKFREVEFPEGIDLKRWEVYGDILDADVVINVPIAKDHGIARLTLGGKNLMGVVTNRGAFHINLGQRVADTLSLVRPALTVIDAVRILMANGPTGGDLADVKLANTVIASADTVAADAYATGLFGLKPTDIAYIKAGAAMGLGTMDLGSVRIDEFEVA
ncbi:MAG: DUF362 domain-containing protein [Anaerolineae bacterium]